ncbi:type III-A CRISPR-associated RAMP protein Csm3 [Flavihumibacter profundi]|uniref:type III-A CRISPR-associated RAMP protein Csm3 n=1 Tax=Flavihumibacter profundi TaxID=2716883 RepID=UPI001CC67E10|nr:type III-A CRISPR-associated RAMP protein Csm3 [Flavihumibacter profundi]MBZ5857562.1 type III-A CRISPR-associated RAMP protein Csm3 [Flavihumibacter profundi]
MQLYKKIIITGELELITGLHIGDSKENVDIGGVDSPVVRRKDNNQPYIPGSSIKGKMRSLLDISHGQSDTTKNPQHPIGQLFGSLGINNQEDGRPSRLIVRDAYLMKESAESLGNSEFTDMPYTEVKFENTINRISGKADHPRQFERVPAGAKFNVEFVINVIANQPEDAARLEKQYMDMFYAGIRLLEDDYLGGSGSRGYGQVKFSFQDPINKTAESYING